jgi:hypothetical protein
MNETLTCKVNDEKYVKKKNCARKNDAKISSEIFLKHSLTVLTSHRSTDNGTGNAPGRTDVGFSFARIYERVEGKRKVSPAVRARINAVRQRTPGDANASFYSSRSQRIFYEFSRDAVRLKTICKKLTVFVIMGLKTS